MWDQSLDPFIRVLEAPSSSILPLLLNVPGYAKSCHIGIYMPTAGQDDNFVAALSDLESTICSVQDQYGEETIIFIRGDMNANSKNKARCHLLSTLITKHA